MITTQDITKALPQQDFENITKVKGSLLKEASFAIQILGTNPKLQECSKESVLKSIWNVATAGLTLNPVQGLAYLTPRYVAGKWECVLIPGYRGLQKLAQDTGVVRIVESRLVYEGDSFDVQYGLNPDIKHKPCGKKETIIAAYAIARLQTGEVQFEVMMKSELELIRDLSDSWKAFKADKVKSAVWNDHEGEMCRKTVVKRLLKYLPKIENPYLDEAIKLDNRDYKASTDQKLFIENLLRSSTLDHEHQAVIENNLEDLSHDQASAIINNLKENQQSVRESGQFSNREINKQLDLIEEKP